MVLIRRATPGDATALRSFACRDPGGSWTRDAERVVRSDVASAVAAGDDDLSVLVAIVDEKMVGVVASSESDEGTFVHVLAVAVPYRRRKIGTTLKRAVMTEAGGTVVSQVHRRNLAMRGLNATLNVVDEKDPEDGEYVISVVVSG